jgi:hypothetical protein
MLSVKPLITTLSLLCMTSVNLVGQEALIQESRRSLSAMKVDPGTITLDGVISENAWILAEKATDFLQFQPTEGKPATEKTEAWVVYDETALYVAIRAYERDPSAITGQYSSRDRSDDSSNDRLGVAFDSFKDRRTAFMFTVNPVGVQSDVYFYDDIDGDETWDAVWDVEVARDDAGWSAEFRIPFSQLRYATDGDQSWGLNFIRGISRKGEMAAWAPPSMKESAVVSRFGDLTGIVFEEQKSSRMEGQIYSTGNLRRQPGDSNDPFYKKNDFGGGVGLDLKYGLTSDLTLDVAINPDFGQVEADPGVMNLTSFESYFADKRPLFSEGSSIFNISLGFSPEDNQSLFYSRRIGAAPTGDPGKFGKYWSADPNVSILGAGKISGKTRSGWSIGLLNAVTGSEKALVQSDVGLAATREVEIEPTTNYGILRVQKDFRQGRSAIGLIATSVNREETGASFVGLHSAAYTGGVDFRHKFLSEKWEFSNLWLASTVRGTASAISETQRRSSRYYQRPDVDHVAFDPTLEMLNGWNVNMSLNKMGGGYWKGGSGLFARSPGFETNDLGYQTLADMMGAWGFLGYFRNEQLGPFRQVSVNGSMSENFDFGRNRLESQRAIAANAMFNNFWRMSFGVVSRGSVLSPQALRGGPMFLREPSTLYFVRGGTDPRKTVRMEWASQLRERSESASRMWNISPKVTVTVGDKGEVSLGAQIAKNVDDSQWITSKIGVNGPEYLLGRINQYTKALTARVRYAFSPNLSLEFYGQPFISSGEYQSFKRVEEPRGESYSLRFQNLKVQPIKNSSYASDIDGDGDLEEFRNPDFRLEQFRSNLVLRWDFSAGSRMFLVWSRGMTSYSNEADFNFMNNLVDLLHENPDDTLMFKISYWLGR